MAKIIIRDLSQNMKVSRQDMTRISGGGGVWTNGKVWSNGTIWSNGTSWSNSASWNMGIDDGTKQLMFKSFERLIESYKSVY